MDDSNTIKDGDSVMLKKAESIKLFRICKNRYIANPFNRNLDSVLCSLDPFYITNMRISAI